MITIHKIYNYAKNILIMLFVALRCETIRTIWVSRDMKLINICIFIIFFHIYLVKKIRVEYNEENSS
jgi:hypothetical protein